MIGRSPEDYLAELTEGLCHLLPRCLLHPSQQSWFLIHHRQVHKEGMDTSSKTPPLEPVPWALLEGRTALPSSVLCCLCSQLWAFMVAVLCLTDCFHTYNRISGILDKKRGTSQDLNLLLQKLQLTLKHSVLGAITGMPWQMLMTPAPFLTGDQSRPKACTQLFPTCLDNKERPALQNLIC